MKKFELTDECIFHHSDLLSDCPKNCADREYSEGVEFNCAMSRMAAFAIAKLLRKVERLEMEKAKLEVRAEQVERERDAAISDLERAEKIAKETYTLINNKIQPVFDYSVYTAIHDSVSDIVDWEKENVWRK